ncbi:MAG: YibE/F family protein [Bacillota bacterium]
MNKTVIKKWFAILAVILILFLISNWLIPTAEFSRSDAADEKYFRGKVLELEEFQTTSGYSQEAQVEITSGPYTGEVVEIENSYEPGNRFLDVRLEDGLRVILVSFQENDQREIYLQDVARDRGLLLAGIILILALLLVGRIKGLETLFTLIITGFVLIRIMLPLMLAGWSPIPVTTVSAIVIIILILTIIGGLNFKTMAAVIGTGSGVIVAGSLAYFIGKMSHLSGLGTQEAQMLSIGLEGLDFRGLLYAGIIIGSLGAITDVGMSIASSAAQIKNVNPQIEFKKLLRHSMQVGRDIMGTMANTLILAYVGGAIPFLLLLLLNEMSWVRIINMNYVATEILSGVAGTIGLIVSIPITALVASFLNT